jgi:hypothetical protein
MDYLSRTAPGRVCRGLALFAYIVLVALTKRPFPFY